MNSLELLRFAWKPTELRLLLAAVADAGPVARRVWVARSGVPANHLAAVMQECERLGGCKLEASPEGIAVLVQPVEFWRVTPLMERAEWAQCWDRSTVWPIVQARLSLATEMPSLGEAMAVEGQSAVQGEGCKLQVQVPGIRESICPDSGSPVKRLNDLTVDRVPLAFNVERLRATGFRAEAGWVEPETEAEALAACRTLLGEQEVRAWGGMWRNRWRANAPGVRKVLNMVREDAAVGRGPQKGSSWGRYASYLWKKYVEGVSA